MDELEQIEWSKYASEGLAEWTKLVLGLLISSEQEDERRVALDELIGQYAHQGSVMPLNVAITPWLLKLLATEGQTRKLWIFELLTSAGFQHPDRGPDHEKGYEILVREIALFERYLNSDVPAYRSMAGKVLAKFGSGDMLTDTELIIVMDK